MFVKDNLILLLLLSVIAFSSVFNLFKRSEIINQGYTPEEVKELIEIELLKQENKAKLDAVKIIEDEFEKDSVFIRGANKHQLDSLFTNYFNRR
jgi:hypothetical protein